MFWFANLLLLFCDPHFFVNIFWFASLIFYVCDFSYEFLKELHILVVLTLSPSLANITNVFLILNIYFGFILTNFFWPVYLIKSSSSSLSSFFVSFCQSEQTLLLQIWEELKEIGQLKARPVLLTF